MNTYCYDKVYEDIIKEVVTTIIPRNPFGRHNGPNYDPYREPVVGESSGFGRLTIGGRSKRVVVVTIGVIITALLITFGIKIVEAGHRGSSTFIWCRRY